MADDTMGGIFNSTVNSAIQVALEDQPLLDPKLTNSFKQLRQAMIDTFEPNKLNSQTRFKAVALLQLDNVTINSKEHIRVIGRIPEIHALIPVPSGKEDYPRISCYPTFFAAIDPLEGIKVPQGGIKVGSELEVTFKNMKSFAGPTLIKVTRDGAPEATAAAKEAMKTAAATPTTHEPPLTEAEADEEVAAVDPPPVGSIGIVDASDSLAANGVAPASPYFLGQTGQKKGQNWFRKDIAPSFVDLYKEVKARGAVFTTAGIGRTSRSTNPQGPGEGFFSFHHLGRAIDLNMASAPFHSRRAAKGLSDSEGGAFTSYEYKDKTYADRMPFIVTVDKNAANRWEVWCQIINEEVAAKWTQANAKGQDVKPDSYEWDLPGACAVEAEKKKGWKKPRAKKWCAETAPAAVQEPTGVPASFFPRDDGPKVFGPDYWDQEGLKKKTDKAKAGYWEAQTGGAWDNPKNPTDVGWRDLDVIVYSRGAGAVLTFKTKKQRVLCFSFTNLAKEYGFDSIPPGKGSRKRTGDVAKLASGEQAMHYRKTEWWHFQNNKPAMIPDRDDPTKFVEKPLVVGKTVYAEELCLVLGSWDKVKEKWGRMCAWHVPSPNYPFYTAGRTMIQLYDLFGPGTKNTTVLAGSGLHWEPKSGYKARDRLLLKKVIEQTGVKNAVLGEHPTAEQKTKYEKMANKGKGTT